MGSDNTSNSKAVLLEYSYGGVELSKIAALKLRRLNGRKNVFAFRQLYSCMLAYNVRKLELPVENGFLATFMESWRKDHYDLFYSVVERISDPPTVNELYKLKKHFSLHPTILISVFKAVLSKLHGTKITLLQKLNLAAEYVLLCNTIKELDSMDFSKVKKYLCMCHVLGLENLLTQYFQNLGIETYSLQEGIYFVYKKNQVAGTIAYENFTTDHLLCWGQYTKDEYVSYGISSEKISVAGYPKCYSLKPLKSNNDYNNCLVMLAGPVFGDVNISLLKMLESLDSRIHFTLKSHPSNYLAMERYANEHSMGIIPQTQSISECMDTGKYDFSIAVNTTAYYESWMAGIPCIRYYDERFDNFYGFNDLFSSRDEFDSLMKQYRVKSKTNQEVREMLEYAIGFGLDNYNRIINGCE